MGGAGDDKVQISGPLLAGQNDGGEAEQDPLDGDILNISP